MIDRGTGPAVVKIPGVQGRWEWMEPAVDALADHCRVITGSLTDDRDSVGSIDPTSGFESYVEWVDTLLDRAGLTEAVVCGVSYGGLVALHHAAVRPQRVKALILVSTPAPTWTPNCRVHWYLRAPRLLSPLFPLSSPFRLYPELMASFPDFLERSAFALRHLYRVTRYPFTPTRMAHRVRLLSGVDFTADCRRVKAPTLVITGDPGLDRVVPVESTREYIDTITGAVHKQLHGTGHIGLITSPDRFREAVGTFIATHHGYGATLERVSA